ncbi:Glycerophosphodiester phosphodiesterase domain-containing protein 5 [Liparis tanakae]|uniref:Glycerophosphodiester phosphodiesterase domain-containing protein 5 n=1 Tax=Liparis tanakae TaxID=230148 RepID=A0A4Z2I7Q2_9TELE|nr:Glycerophosphodiester phosphodiesterase domain-containing protein 5 [Liparis tanakae]
MVKHQPLQVYERQLCLSCITGLYGCRWKRYQRSHDDTTKVVIEDHGNQGRRSLINEQSRLSQTYAVQTEATGSSLGLQLWELLWSLILLFTFCLLLVWFYFWWEAHNDYNEFNWFLYNCSGEWSDGTIPILAATAAGFTYIAFLMIGVTAALLTTTVGVISVNQTWGQEWDVIPISLQATGPFLHIGALAAVTALSWIVAGQVARAEKTNSMTFLPNVDGVPFLMHDHTLRRTTDIEKVFPDRQMQDASFFNWTDLQQLNAGKWFLKEDPFWTVHSLSPRERSLIANQSVCSLEQLLKLASYHNSTVVFRLRRPPPTHPCYHSWINDTLQAVQQSGVPQSLSNINLTLYTINEPWLYSVLWCSGVSSVSSEASHILKKVPYPIWLMRPDEYRLMWVSVDLVSFAAVIGIFIFQKYRMSGMRSYNPEQIMLSAAVRRNSRDLNVMKEKLIFSEVGNGVGGADEHYPDDGYDYYTNQGISQ